MTKKIIKLINNERISTKIASAKACESDSYDFCSVISYLRLRRREV